MTPSDTEGRGTSNACGKCGQTIYPHECFFAVSEGSTPATPPVPDDRIEWYRVRVGEVAHRDDGVWGYHGQYVVAARDVNDAMDRALAEARAEWADNSPLYVDWVRIAR